LSLVLNRSAIMAAMLLVKLIDSLGDPSLILMESSYPAKAARSSPRSQVTMVEALSLMP